MDIISSLIIIGTIVVPCISDTTPVYCTTNPPQVANAIAYRYNASGAAIEINDQTTPKGFQHKAGQGVKYVCQGGGTMTGSAVLTCQTTGKWGPNAAPTCTAGSASDRSFATDCRGAPTITNGKCQLEVSTGEYSNGFGNGRKKRQASTTQYATCSCSSGFSLRGNQRLACSSGGWGTLPTCAAINQVSTLCSTPPKIANGLCQQEVSTGEYSNGLPNGRRKRQAVPTQYVKCSCSSGYTLIGNQRLGCTSSGWDTLPTCAAPVANCNNVPQISNGDCATAVSDGEYSNGLPRNLPAASRSLPPSRRLQCSCRSGMALSGAAVVTCNNGMWSALPTCLAGSSVSYCSARPQIANGVCQIQSMSDGEYSNGMGSSNQVSTGQYLKCSCNQGYVLSGSGNVACSSTGAWGALPTCVSGGSGGAQVFCSSPPQVNNADCYKGIPGETDDVAAIRTSRVLVNSTSRSSSIYTSGQTVRFICRDGFKMSGSGILTCLSNGEWSAPPTCTAPEPTCTGATLLQTNAVCRVPSDGITPNDVNNQKYASTYFKVGDQVECRCKDGYQLNGLSSLVCGSQGGWSPLPTCFAIPTTTAAPVTCPKPPPLDGAGCNNCARALVVFVPGDQVGYSCRDDYVIVGSPLITCQNNGQWSQMPACVPKATTTPKVMCSDPPTVDGAGCDCGDSSGPPRLFDVGTQITYSCREGYVRSGSPSVKCQSNGKWTQPPTCTRRSG